MLTRGELILDIAISVLLEKVDCLADISLKYYSCSAFPWLI